VFCQKRVTGTLTRLQMSQEYVANGSRHKSKIVYSVSEAGNPTSVAVDIGTVYPVPTSVRSITISLVKEVKDGNEVEIRTIVRDLQANDGKECDTSIIITEEGCIARGHRNKDVNDGDWMWKSSSDETDHKPRKFFVANASTSAIRVDSVADKSSNSSHVPAYKIINCGETETIDYDRVKIVFNHLVIFEGTVKPRTSVVVCSGGTVKTTGRLYGEDIEAQKWIADGMNYKPTGQ